MWNGFPVVTGCTHDIAEGGAFMPSGQDRRHRSEEGGPASRRVQYVQPGSVCSEICTALECQKDQLNRKEEELRLAERACKNALEKIQKEQDTWIEKMEIVRKRLKAADEKKREAKMMLKLHETLEKSGELLGTMRTVERIIAEGPSSGARTRSGEVARSTPGIRHALEISELEAQREGGKEPEGEATGNEVERFDYSDTKECVTCNSDFSTESFILIKPKERCRHLIRPCGHIICGKCARQVWSTTKRCPVCSGEMMKKPKIFRPPRYQ
ncbi:hypothetical protein BSKO_11103 [Bryopsis sp. KO-2023]|nr:hypothetical protein BSKO_11103 [Bryopsis sp. KO-2023]